MPGAGAGSRIHEGTDIFANYGVPVHSTVYGIVEMKGWNKYGGWRIGIRDINNKYHYFAHLNGFAKVLSRTSSRTRNSYRKRRKLWVWTAWNIREIPSTSSLRNV